MTKLREQAQFWLTESLGAGADFREGQWEAIQALVEKRQRVLVVQRTGWGKSMVYFMATRLLREQGAGFTLLISPLLSLMRNQVQAANRWGVRARSMDSTNSEDHHQIESELLKDQVDLLMVSPERLANERFQDVVWANIKARLGLMVIDEAHCISDWGHDFRPNYRRMMYLLDELPTQIPVLGTTATANNRVVADVAEILGAGLHIQRGRLTRDSLSLYVYPERLDHAERLVLLSHLLQKIRGSGIIYCTTTRDCQVVAEWLQSEGFNVKPYYADIGQDRASLEDQLLNNEVKALVASVALGMGFDKPDLHFVIHYQLVGSIISYYQQIGRAGRGLEQAHIILMQGEGDTDIQDYFIETAFPHPAQLEEVIRALATHGTLTKQGLQKHVNAKQSVLEKILIHLEVEGIIWREGREFELINAHARPDYTRWERITALRRAEMEHMRAYVQHQGCLMQFIAKALDDPTDVPACGRCKNCKGSQSSYQPDAKNIARAQTFLRQGNPIHFEARKMWPSGFLPKSKIALINEKGIALTDFFGAGWGEQVRRARQKNNFYSDELLSASLDLLRDYLTKLATPPQWVTSVPSLHRPEQVLNLAQGLAKGLNLPYHSVVQQVAEKQPQMELQNSLKKLENVWTAYEVAAALPLNAPVLLIDDFADSRWTLTVIGHRLREAACPKVYPFVLALTGAN